MTSGSENPTARALAEAIDLHRRGDIDRAEAAYLRILKADPERSPAWANLATIRRDQGFADAAVAMTLRAMETREDYRRLGNNLINALRDAGRGAEGLRLEVIDPANIYEAGPVDPLWRALSLLIQGRAREALPHFEKGLEGEPLSHPGNIDRVMAHLKAGEFRRGFDRFEARWHQRADATTLPDPARRWRGEALEGRHIHVLPEQGLGDQIFLARFIPELVRRNPARITLVVKPPLERLFAAIEGVHAVELKGEARLPAAATWTFAFDLPRHLLPEGAAFPPLARFALPDAAVARAEALVRPYRERFKIGVVWGTTRTGRLANMKSVRFRDFLSLCEIPGLQLFNLFKEDGESEISRIGAQGLVVDAAASDADLADTAALIDALDLVITVDTAVAHLAGAMGAQTWMLTPEPPFWYWHGVGEHTPYYPTMRVIRQSSAGEWGDVFARIRNDLTRMLR